MRNVSVQSHTINKLHQKQIKKKCMLDQMGGVESSYRNADGKLHKIDGPAVEYKDGEKEWWTNGVKFMSKGPKTLKKNLKGRLEKQVFRCCITFVVSSPIPFILYGFNDKTAMLGTLVINLIPLIFCLWGLIEAFSKETDENIFDWNLWGKYKSVVISTNKNNKTGCLGCLSFLFVLLLGLGIIGIVKFGDGREFYLCVASFAMLVILIDSYPSKPKKNKRRVKRKIK